MGLEKHLQKELPAFKRAVRKTTQLMIEQEEDLVDDELEEENTRWMTKKGKHVASHTTQSEHLAAGKGRCSSA